MAFFEIERFTGFEPNRKVGLIEAPDGGAALARLREGGCPTNDSDFDSGKIRVRYSLSSPLGGWPDSAATVDAGLGHLSLWGPEEMAAQSASDRLAGLI
jgi:hypothetical protein